VEENNKQQDRSSREWWLVEATDFLFSKHWSLSERWWNIFNVDVSYILFSYVNNKPWSNDTFV